MPKDRARAWAARAREQAEEGEEQSGGAGEGGPTRAIGRPHALRLACWADLGGQVAGEESQQAGEGSSILKEVS